MKEELYQHLEFMIVYYKDMELKAKNSKNYANALMYSSKAAALSDLLIHLKNKEKP